MKSIAVIGGGAFGTALAIAMASDNSSVKLWMRDAAYARQVQLERDNMRRLPGVLLPDGLIVTPELKDLSGADCTLLVLPAQQTEAFLKEFGALLPAAPLVFCAKGLTLDQQKLQTDLLPVSQDCGVLTGPGFADEIARGLPTALVIAGPEGLVEALQAGLARPKLRLYRTTDTVGVQLGGALKNVVAIAAGISTGAGFGESARAALVTRGFAEMRKLALAMGARDETLAGLSGLGDLMLTCSSTKSRNFAYGLSLGRGTIAVGGTIEGVATTEATIKLGQRLGVEMPVAQAVSAVLGGREGVDIAVQNLLSRPLRAEV